MSKNGISWIPILSVTTIIVALFSAFLAVMVYLSGCKELPEVEVSPDLQYAVCLEACHLARDKGCEQLGKDDLTAKACEPLCHDIIARVPIPNIGCALEAATCEKIGACW